MGEILPFGLLFEGPGEYLVKICFCSSYFKKVLDVDILDLQIEL
jgi:hypothetical protein